MKGIVDEVVGAFNGHLESAASAAKLHFRWVKRRYRQKIDVNRVAARIELKVRPPSCSISIGPVAGDHNAGLSHRSWQRTRLALHFGQGSLQRKAHHT